MPLPVMMVTSAGNVRIMHFLIDRLAVNTAHTVSTPLVTSSPTLVVVIVTGRTPNLSVDNPDNNAMSAKTKNIFCFSYAVF